MGKQGFAKWLKEKICGIGWSLFIWGLGISADEYRRQIYEEEKLHEDEKHVEPAIVLLKEWLEGVSDWPYSKTIISRTIEFLNKIDAYHFNSRVD